jgi:two-component system C4-dicarboxylate transport sensor histidine kinase DctB
MISVMYHVPSISRLLADISTGQLRELQRFAEVGRLSAGLIHDMTSPLTAAILHLEQSESSELPGVQRARRSIQVLERYVEAARQQLSHQYSARVFRVEPEVRQAKQILQPLAKRRQVYLKFSSNVNGSLLGDPVRFQRILTNLVTNAIDSYQDTLSDNPKVNVMVRSESKKLILMVKDWGEGIDDEQMPHLFKPFYTTKQFSKTSGTGLGLATVKQYVEEDFCGSIKAISNIEQGTEIRVILPLHSKDPP